jgi:hypothetical protein
MRTSIERQRPTRQPRFPHTAVRLGFFMAALAGLVLLQPSAAFADSVSAYDLYSFLMLGSSRDSSHDLELAGNGKRDTTERALKTPSHRLSKVEKPQIPHRPILPGGRQVLFGDDRQVLFGDDVVDQLPHRPNPGGKHVAAAPEPTAGLLFGAGTLLVARRLRRR